MGLRQVPVKVAGREFTVTEPTFGVVREASAADDGSVVLLLRCVEEFADDDPAQLDQVPAIVADRLLCVINELMSTEPD